MKITVKSASVDESQPKCLFQALQAMDTNQHMDAKERKIPATPTKTLVRIQLKKLVEQSPCCPSTEMIRRHC